jgi:putative membrane protein
VKNQIIRFMFRWLANFLALLLIFVTGLLGNIPNTGALLAGALILALLNGILKPVVVIFTLPAIALSLGFFLIIINGAIFYIAGKIYSPLEASSFWVAILAGLVVGLVNYSLTLLLEAVSNE